jgi:hypothetical protein
MSTHDEPDRERHYPDDEHEHGQCVLHWVPFAVAVQRNPRLASFGLAVDGLRHGPDLLDSMTL